MPGAACRWAEEGIGRKAKVRRLQFDAAASAEPKKLVDCARMTTAAYLINILYCVWAAAQDMSCLVCCCRPPDATSAPSCSLSSRILVTVPPVRSMRASLSDQGPGTTGTCGFRPAPAAAAAA